MKICKMAVKQNRLALEYIDSPNKKLCKLAVQQNTLSLKFCNKSIDYTFLFNNKIELEIDICLICSELKEYYVNYTCNKNHICCLDCALKIESCFFRCEQYIDFNNLLFNKIK